MDTYEAKFKSLDGAMWELAEALGDMPDEELWRRAAPSLLSIGELLSHLCFWEAKSFLTEVPASPLTDVPAREYVDSRDAPLTLSLTVMAAREEVEKIHRDCREKFLSDRPDLASPNPLRQGWTWDYTLEYQAFHIAYHTGQVYSVRHLLGHVTPEN